MNKNYRLIDANTLETVAELDDFELEYDMHFEQMKIKPLSAGGVKIPGVNAPKNIPRPHIPEAGLEGLPAQYHHLDTMDLMREIFLRVDKLLKLYGHEQR